MESIEKRLSGTIKAIENFFSENFYEVRCSPVSIDKAVAKTIKKDEGLYFEFAKMPLIPQRDIDLILKSNEFSFQFSNYKDKIFLNPIACSNFKINVGFTDGYTKLNGYIKEFTTESLHKLQNGFYRAVIVTEKDFYVSKYFACQSLLKVKGAVYMSGVLEIQVNEMILHLFSYADETTKRKYFVIESQNVVDYTTFSSILDEIVLAITYLTGLFLGPEIYIIGSKEESFRENIILCLKRFFDDLMDGYSTVPNLYFQQDLKVPEIQFQTEYLENLIGELCKSLVYKRTVLLLCQAHSEPHYVKSTLYSVALETITNIISERANYKVNLISDKKIAKRIRLRLKEVLKDFKEVLEHSAYEKIKSSIDGLNSATNNQKLLVPFEYFKIKLPKKDIDAIKRRNDFLHGRIPESADQHYLPMVNYRLLFCINCLVLKLINFKGYITYYPVIYQMNNKIDPEEYPIRKI